MQAALLAQLVERTTEDREVAGSNPAEGNQSSQISFLPQLTSHQLSVTFLHGEIFYFLACLAAWHLSEKFSCPVC